ncbi:MAG: hypothetical protein L6V93_21630 [Clostridiales bacterium]|nr:MAG: hypothetical protein L6V93_21630 [Clostridiales bacterium]
MLAVKALVSAPQSYEKIRAAATIKDGRLTPENEGKLVVVSGTLKPAEQLQDPITGVKLPGGNGEKERFGLMNGIPTAMMNRCGTGSLRIPTTAKKANFGINAEILTTTMLAAPTLLGEFKVESKLLNPLIRNTEFTQYDEESLKDGWNVLSGGKESRYCVSKEHWLPKKSTGMYSTTGYGSQKISYGIVSPDDPLEYTIIGVQKGDTLIKSEDVDSVTTVKGNYDVTRVLPRRTKKACAAARFFGIVAGILLAIIGVGMMAFRRQ